MEKTYSKTRILVECAIMIAVSTVLSLVKVYEAPLGGSITLGSMVPMIILSYRHGIKWGMEASLVYSVLQLVLGIGAVSYVPSFVGVVLCVLFDYIIAFTVIGFAGILRGKMNNEYVAVTIGAVMACVMRFLCHLVSGAVVWYSITKEGQWNELVNKFGMWTYSLIYNAQYMIPETIITIVATPLVFTVVNGIDKSRRK